MRRFTLAALLATAALFTGTGDAHARLGDRLRARKSGKVVQVATPAKAIGIARQPASVVIQAIGSLGCANGKCPKR